MRYLGEIEHMFRAFFFLLVLCLNACLALPADAQDSASACGEIKPIDPDVLGSYTRSLVRLSTANKYKPLVDALAIRVDNSGSTTYPEIHIASSAAELVVPGDIFQHLCRNVFEVEKALGIPHESDIDRQAVRLGAVAAFRFLIMHEFNHLVVRRTYTASRLQRTDEELEADLSAAIVLGVSDDWPIGPITTLMVMEQREAAGGVADDTHYRGVCRLSILTDFLKSAYPKIGYIEYTARGQEEAGKRLADNAFLARILAPRPDVTKSCPKGINRHYASFLFDVDATYEVACAIAAASSADEQQRLASSRLHLDRTKTIQGKMLAEYLLADTFVKEGHGIPLITGQPISDAGRATISHAIAALNVAFPASQLDEISSENALSIEILRALMRFVAHPAGTSVSTAAGQLARDIDAESLVIDPMIWNQKQAFDSQFVTHKLSTSHLGDTIKALDDVRQFAYLTSVDCGHIDQARFAVPITEQQCRTLQPVLRSRVAAGLQWVAD